MTPYEIAAVSVLAMVLLIFLGMHVAVVLALVSFVGVLLIRGDWNTALFHLWGAVSQSINSSVFAVVPLYVLMGNLAAAAGLGRDTYDLAHRLIGSVRGSLGVATVFANAIFAAVTGVSVASASIFAKLAVPEMVRHGYRPPFAAGVVAGSSVLGMLIPPSVLMIVYGIIAEQSIGDMFIAGIGPGIVLTAAFSLTILLLARRMPRWVMLPDAQEHSSRDPVARPPARSLMAQALPVTLLVGIVMGGIYGGIFTALEAAAIGALTALMIALARRALNWKSFFDLLVDSGNVTAVVLFMIVGASMYSRMLGVSGLPTQIGLSIQEAQVGYWMLIALYIGIIVVLGCLIDSVSIMLIMVPLFMVILQPYNIDLVWLGIITILAAEIGLLTPPFGLSVYVVHSTLGRSTMPLKSLFASAGLFAAVMFLVLLLILFFPSIATFLVRTKFS